MLPTNDNPSTINLEASSVGHFNVGIETWEAMPDQDAIPNEIVVSKPVSEAPISETEQWGWLPLLDFKDKAKRKLTSASLNEKLEKNSNLVQNGYVDTKKFILSILESGKSKEEIVDLLAALIEASADNSPSQNKVDFETAANVEACPPLGSKRRPKLEPENFAEGTAEYELALVRKRIRERTKRSRELKAARNCNL